MKQHEVIIGETYLFVNNGHQEDKKRFHNRICVVLKRVKGKEKTTEFHRNKRGKKPDKFLLDIGCYANAANLKQINKT